MFKTTRLFGLIFMVLLSLTGLGEAKNFEFERIEQDIYLEPGGMVRVEDVRTYRFYLDPGDANFKRAFLDVRPRAGGRVVFAGVDVLDGKPGGDHTVDGSKITFSSPAGNETRRFRIRYSLSNELQVADDAALFDRRVLEETHKPVGVYTVRIHAPANSPDRFKVFTFTSRSRIGTLEFDAPKRVALVTLKPLNEDEAVRTKVILSAAGFSIHNIVGKRYEQWLGITKQETSDFRQASGNVIKNGQSGQGQNPVSNGGFFAPPAPAPVNGWWLFAPFAGLAVLLERLLFVYQRFGREPSVGDVGRYFREPAEVIPPGVVPFVLSQADPGSTVASTAISATLLDLTRRGFLEMVRGRSSGLFGLGAKDETHFKLLKGLPGDSPVFELRLLSMLRAADNGDGTITPAELQAYVRQTTSSLSDWAALPRRWYEQKFGALMDPAGAQGWWVVLPGLLLSGLAIFAGFVVLGSFESNTPGVAIMVAGMVGLLASIFTAASLGKWQPQKLENARKWQAYRRFLADFSQLEQAPSEHYKLWDYHFCYAAALGVADKYLKNIGTLMERNPGAFVHPYWMGGDGLAGGSNLAQLEQMISSVNSLQQITQNLSSLERALDSNSSVGGGFGGGSMGGSSGGGGSSGAE